MAPRAATALCAALALVVALALGALRATPELSLFRAPGVVPFLGWPAPRASFVPLGPGLHKLDLPWYVTPFHRETIDMYALDLGSNRWALSDAGGFDTPWHAHATALHTALRALMGAEGTLTHVLRACPAAKRAGARRSRVRLAAWPLAADSRVFPARAVTHGHLDHVGALPLLLRAYPACVVVYHEAESRYLVNGEPWTPHWWRSGVYSPGFVLAHALGFLPRAQYALPAGRGVALSGAGGSLASLGVPGVTWQHLPGHAPSHVAYAHAKSRTLLAGDLADFLLDPPGVKTLPDGRPIVKGQPAMYTLTIFAGADAALARRSLCRVAYDSRVSYDAVRFAHDATKSAHTRAELQPLAEAAAQCGGKF